MDDVANREGFNPGCGHNLEPPVLVHPVPGSLHNSSLINDNPQRGPDGCTTSLVLVTNLSRFLPVLVERLKALQD